MAKIKCPHCGATNQDVTEQEPCWQCGAGLSGSSADLAAETAPSAGGRAPEPSSLDRFITADSRPNRAPLIIAILLILVLLLVVGYVVYLRGARNSTAAAGKTVWYNRGKIESCRLGVHSQEV